VAGGSNSLLRLVRTNGAGHTLWDVWSPYFCWHGIGDFQRHPVYNTVWITSRENRTGGQNFRSYLYSVDVNGQFLFGVRGIPNMGGDLTPTSDGMICIETDPDAPNYHIMAKRIRISGRVLWQSLVATYFFFNESCAPDGADGVVVAMNDGRYGPPDWSNIAAQRVLANGQLGSPHISIIPQGRSHIESVSTGWIRYSLAQAGEVRLDLFDLMGRRIATLQEGFKQPRSYMVPIDQQHLPSGVYLVRLNTPVGSEAARVIIAK